MAFCFVLIPFKDGFDVLAECLESLLPQLTEGVEVVLVDDGSNPEAGGRPVLATFLEDARFHLLSHDINQGPAQARNTGLAWCGDAGAEIVILLDSDCLAKQGFIDAHVRLHEAHPDRACIGGAIHGQGKGVWAALDALMSWFSSIPGTPARTVNEPYHLPSTNMSLKLRKWSGGDVFNPRLKTGEDVAFVKDLRARGETVFFSPEPEIIHRDRDSLGGFFRHQYRWGLHTYVVRFGEKHLSFWRRALFALAFIPGFPVYVVLATWLNVAPWLKRSPVYLLYVPLLFLLYAVKGVAVFSGAVNPGQALYPKKPSAS
jgi:glycosyltransferase involved in cell wall biosynthesis